MSTTTAWWSETDVSHLDTDTPPTNPETLTAVATWDSLTKTSRHALMHPNDAMSPTTRRALVGRGLLDPDGRLTRLGAAAVDTRNDPSYAPAHHARKQNQEDTDGQA